MAIAFGRTANNVSATGTSPVAVTITLNAGETGVLTFTTVGATLATVSTITGGGTWTRQSTVTNGTVKQEIWATPVNGATAAASVSVAFSAGSDGVTVMVAAYTGVGSLGITGTATGTTTSAPSLALTTQDANNWVVAGFGISDAGGSTPTASSGNLRGAVLTIDSGAQNQAAALVDNTAAGASAVTCTIGYASAGQPWAAAALELRSVAGAVTGPPRRDLARTSQWQGLVAQ